MVQQRLSGEKGRLPARVYARPLVLQPGMQLSAEQLVKVLNGLRYAERQLPTEPGQFAVSEAGVTLFPRPVPDGAQRAARGVVRDRQAEGDARARHPQPLEAPRARPDARARARHLPLRRGPREKAPRALRGAARPSGEGGARDRGPPLLQPSRARPDRPHARRAPQPAQRRRSAGRQHDHAAAVQELLPAPHRRARLQERGAELEAQAAGGAAGVRARAQRHQAGDPRDVPERGLPRPVGLVRDQRRGRGGADLLRQGRDQPDADRVRPARGHDPVAEPVQPVPPRGARDRAQERGGARDAGRGLHRQGHDGAGAGQPAAGGAAEPRQQPTRPTSSTSSASSWPSATRPRTWRRATCRSTRRSTCTCRRSRSRRCSAGSCASRR